MNDLNVVDNDLNLQPITRWLVSANNGDTQARARLYEAVYPVLRRMAASKPGVRIGATLSPTMVVSELFLKITGGSAMESQDRHHFFATCSRAMRFIITDFARTAASQKRGGDLDHCPLTTALASQPDQAQELLDIDAALVDLESLEPRLRELVELKFFGGLSHIEIGELHGRSERSVKRDWIRARAFLVARTSIDGYA
jgi:RNA polymerase sigma factor (TIGR02999 family)